MSTCYVDPNPRFKPAMKLIAAVTNSNPAIVTTTTNHEYVDGTIVRFDIPLAVGMNQLEKMTGKITTTGATTFMVDIDTTSFDVFAIPVAPSWHDNTCAQVLPIGEDGNQLVQGAIEQDVTG